MTIPAVFDGLYAERRVEAEGGPLDIARDSFVAACNNPSTQLATKYRKCVIYVKKNDNNPRFFAITLKIRKMEK